jgi:hypothetical protein
MLSAAERKLRARIAANQANWTRLLDQVDPNRVLDPVERDRRATALFRAEQARKSLLALKARRLRQKAAAGPEG